MLVFIGGVLIGRLQCRQLRWRRLAFTIAAGLGLSVVCLRLVSLPSRILAKLPGWHGPSAATACVGALILATTVVLVNWGDVRLRLAAAGAVAAAYVYAGTAVISNDLGSGTLVLLIEGTTASVTILLGIAAGNAMRRNTPRIPE